jgi:serine/threonine protein kinase
MYAGWIGSARLGRTVRPGEDRVRGADRYDPPAVLALPDGAPPVPGVSGLVPLAGAVRRGTSDRTGQPVAVKVLPAQFDRDTRDQFDADRTRLGRLRHVPSILQIDDVDVLEDGRPYVVTELCADSVDALLERGERLNGEEVAAVGFAAASALAAAHGAGVQHGRVTPANLLVRVTGQPVLSDFGSAVRRSDPSDGDQYTAPETLRDGTVTARSDLYGLGATLYAGAHRRAAVPVPGRGAPGRAGAAGAAAGAAGGRPGAGGTGAVRAARRAAGHRPGGPAGDAARVAARFDAMLAARVAATPPDLLTNLTTPPPPLPYTPPAPEPYHPPAPEPYHPPAPVPYDRWPRRPRCLTTRRPRRLRRLTTRRPRRPRCLTTRRPRPAVRCPRLRRHQPSRRRPPPRRHPVRRPRPCSRRRSRPARGSRPGIRWARPRR